VRHRIAATFEDLGDQQVKNIVDPVRVFRVHTAGAGPAPVRAGAAPSTPPLLSRRMPRRWIAGGALALLLAVALATFAVMRASGRWQDSGSAAPLFSLAVLPFKSGPGAADAAFAGSFTRDLTTALSRSVLGSPVASSAAVAAYKGQPGDVRAMGQQLNVRYLVEGEVRRSVEQIVAAAQLIDTRTGAQVWGASIETPVAKLAAIPDLAVIRTNIAVRYALWDAERRRLSDSRPADDTPMEAVFRARAIYNDGTRNNVLAGMRLCQSALQREPNLAPAMVCKAELITELLDLGANPERAALVREADELTRRALRIDGDDAHTWRIRAEALRLQYQWDAALDANGRSIRLDPSRVSTLDVRGLYMAWTGRPEEVFPLVARSAEITPDNVGFDQRVACRAWLALGRYDEAIAACERSASEDEYYTVHVYLAAAYAQKGLLATAAEERDKALHQNPEFSVAWYGALLRQVSDNEKAWEQYKRFIEPGLIKAGFPPG